MRDSFHCVNRVLSISHHAGEPNSKLHPQALSGLVSLGSPSHINIESYISLMIHNPVLATPLLYSLMDAKRVILMLIR